MKNIFYITTDNPKNVQKIKNKIIKLGGYKAKGKDRYKKPLFADRSDPKNIILYTHIIAPFLATNGEAQIDSSKKDVYYILTIENDMEASIEQCEL